ncbi:DNA repair protein RecO [Pseudomonas typographi]|uniref:DNA repair protein RecO n=1 Tax=Pseudomonas typographi TaxID=2715964 RepID=A0ABR7YWG3_9PSED|nr:DNA repair protein RecO [Pseudomonas typographi]MBD1597509.1 DNA repair protein RecO [Pseudomonas typographi]
MPLTTDTHHAYVLHTRPYRETSALVDFFSAEGVVRGVLRSARGKAGSVARPFAPLEVALRGRGELKTVARLEPTSNGLWLTGQALFSGLYMNELLVRLLPAQVAHPALYEHYQLTLQALAEGRALEPLLRSYEWRLLDELGYAFALDHDLHGQPLAAQAFYRLQPEAGLEPIAHAQPGMFLGADLLAMAEADWAAPGALAAAKRLMRQALAAHLGGRPLVSRELFRKP